MPRRVIEEAFPLQKVSKDSKHEKNVRHGHISTLHIWPARRPLAACRAVTIATLLPDPADAPEKMKAEYTRLAGSPLPDKQRDYLCNTLIASLTRWGDENGHADWNAKDKNGRWLNKLRIARELIQMAYDGDPPKVMDMFAGGGAIPLEAMRLGCEVTANDYNPVAWFILKCTLEYPQRFAGKTHPIPDLNLDEKPDLKNGDLADHVRLWGQWVLENARKELAQYYPVIDNKPTVAYLWARTVPCQDPQCGATVPLLKTLWVCKKAEKTLKDTPENRNRPDFLREKKTKNQTRVVINAKRALKLCPDPKTKRVRFEIITPTNADDVGEPTMSGATATCPFCESQQPTDYIKRCGHEGKLKAQMTTVVYQEEYGKEYRPPTQKEIDKAEIPTEALEAVADQIPYGMPDEPMPGPQTLGFGIALYGFKKWSDAFTNRQLLALMIFVKWTQKIQDEIKRFGYSAEWMEEINGYLACTFNRMLDFSSTFISWISSAEAIGHTFVRYALPMTWDFSEMVCRKRPANAKTGHYSKVKREMQKRITERLRYFWDEGIRGPDFVWAAIGPALENYSSHKEVKRMDGQIFTVTEFLTEVRRMVTDFALGQILHGTSTEALDEWTRYYLMHKDYFRTENAPVGEGILLAQGYGVPLDDLRDRHIGILKKASSGNALKLLGHTERTSDRIGYVHTSGRIPMIDMIHRVMKLWDAGEREQINAYFHEHGLQENPLFKAVVQALIETSPQGSSERSLMEALINYEPGEFSGISSSRQSTNQTEQQLTLEEMLSK